MGKAAELHFAGKYCTTYSQDSRISIVITHKFIHSIFQKLLFQIIKLTQPLNLAKIPLGFYNQRKMGQKTNGNLRT